MMARVPIGDVASFKKGAGLAKADLAVGGTHPCVHYGELFTQYGAVINTVISRTDRDMPVKSIEGDVLMPTSDVTPRGLAKASAIQQDGVGLGGDILVIRPDHSKVDARFLAHAIRHDVNQVLALVRGSTVYHLYAADMRNFEVTLPTLAEQARVAEALKDADDLVAMLERLIAKRQAVKQGMMQQLLTGRIRLRGFSSEWRDVRLGDVARFSKGSGLPKSDLAPDGSTPCVHYGELFTHYGPEIDRVTSRTNNVTLTARSQPLDVLMPTSDVTPRGLAKASAVHESDVILGGDILIVRPDRSAIYGPFLAHVIRHDANQVLQLVRGSTVYHLYATDMRNFNLTIPTVEEQRAIAAVLKDVEAEIVALTSRLRKAQAVKVGMMQELLTGRTSLSAAEIAP